MSDRTVGTPAEEDLRQRPVGELVKQLAEDTSRLVRDELKLAKLEASERASELGRAGGMLAGAGVAALLALGALTACLIAALDAAMPLWLAALIITLLWGAIAAAVGLAGRKRLQETRTPIPENTIQDAKEDVAWLQQRTRT